MRQKFNLKNLVQNNKTQQKTQINKQNALKNSQSFIGSRHNGGLDRFEINIVDDSIIYTANDIDNYFKSSNAHNNFADAKNKNSPVQKTFTKKPIMSRSMDSKQFTNNISQIKVFDAVDYDDQNSIQLMQKKNNAKCVVCKKQEKQRNVQVIAEQQLSSSYVFDTINPDLVSTENSSNSMSLTNSPKKISVIQSQATNTQQLGAKKQLNTKNEISSKNKFKQGIQQNKSGELQTQTQNFSKSSENLQKNNNAFKSMKQLNIKNVLMNQLVDIDEDDCNSYKLTIKGFRRNTNNPQQKQIPQQGNFLQNLQNSQLNKQILNVQKQYIFSSKYTVTPVIDKSCQWQNDIYQQNSNIIGQNIQLPQLQQAQQYQQHLLSRSLVLSSRSTTPSLFLQKADQQSLLQLLNSINCLTQLKINKISLKQSKYQLLTYKQFLQNFCKYEDDIEEDVEQQQLQLPKVFLKILCSEILKMCKINVKTIQQFVEKQSQLQNAIQQKNIFLERLSKIEQVEQSMMGYITAELQGYQCDDTQLLKESTLYYNESQNSTNNAQDISNNQCQNKIANIIDVHCQYDEFSNNYYIMLISEDLQRGQINKVLLALNNKCQQRIKSILFELEYYKEQTTDQESIRKTSVLEKLLKDEQMFLQDIKKNYTLQQLFDIQQKYDNQKPYNFKQLLQ